MPMMKIRWMLFTLLLALVATTADGQKKRRTPAKQAPTPEEQARQAMVERMTANTAVITIVDSIVVNKKDFLSQYILNPEAGSIDSYQKHYNTDRQPNAYVYVNQLGNRCYLSQENNEGIISLYASERVGNKWTRPTKIAGLNDKRHFQQVNYPFMMGDGETFYFAAKSDDPLENLGGYDIYTSSYDKETGRFLTPVNMGMPFNSEANDYMMAIDEYSNIGYFASDRNQPEDTVCIYIFVPYEVRKVYDPEDHTPEEIADFARISSISKTWTDQQAVSMAQARLQMTRDRKRQQVRGHDFTFVINDATTYYHLSDFRDKTNVKRYHELANLRRRYQKLAVTLDKARQYYITASNDERQELSDEILTSEKKLQALENDIHNTEKLIRNSENIFLTKKN